MDRDSTSILSSTKIPPAPSPNKWTLQTILTIGAAAVAIILAIVAISIKGVKGEKGDKGDTGDTGTDVDTNLADIGIVWGDTDCTPLGLITFQINPKIKRYYLQGKFKMVGAYLTSVRLGKIDITNFPFKDRTLSYGAWNFDRSVHGDVNITSTGDVLITAKDDDRWNTNDVFMVMAAWS